MIEVSLARRLVDSQFPQWSDLPIAAVEFDGWDNRTFRLGSELTVRLPSGDWYARQVEKEQRWLPVLAPQLPLPIPTPVAKGTPDSGFPYPWSVYRWLDGDVASKARVGDMTGLATTLAGFLNVQAEFDIKEVPMGLSDSRVEAVIAVSDLDRARRFYEDQLGLAPGEEEEGQSVRYSCGEGTRIFIYLSPDNAGKSSATLAGWLVDDLDQTMDELASRGVVFEQYNQPGIETDERGVFDAGRFRAAWIKDPDSNTMAITAVSS